VENGVLDIMWKLDYIMDRGELGLEIGYWIKRLRISY